MALIIPPGNDEDWAIKVFDIVDWHKETLVGMARHRARVAPYSVLYKFLGDGVNVTDQLTSVELDEAAAAIAAGLHHFGKIGDRVLLLCGNDLNYIKAFFGCLYAGMIPASGVHVDTLRSDERFEMIIKDADPQIIIGPRKILTDYQLSNHKKTKNNIIWVPLEMLLACHERLAIQGNNQDVAFIQYTSGSTRKTRGVVLTHRNLLYNLRYQGRTHEARGQELGLSWLPFAHDMGLIGTVLSTIGGGGQCFLLPPKYFAEKPSRWLEAISRYKVNLTGAPNFAYDLSIRNFTDDEVTKLDLSHWNVAFNGAETANSDVMSRFIQKFAPAGFKARSFVFCYGLAEATLVVTRGKRGISPKFRSFSRNALMRGFAWPSTSELDRRILISCGTSLEEQKIIIVDPKTGQSLRDGRVGEIWISGPSVAKGYFNQAEETEEVFYAQTNEGKGPFLRTGDLGFILSENLYFSGRVSNVIVLRGKVYDPDDISASLEESCDDIRSHATAIFLENKQDLTSVTIIVELVVNPKRACEEISSVIHETVSKVYDVWPRNIILTRRGGILKTPSGKIQIAKTCQALKENALPVIARFVFDVPDFPPPLSYKEAYVNVDQWLSESTKDWGIDIKSLTREQLVNGGINTEQLVQLRRDFEGHFRVQIDPSEYVAACQNWGDLCDLLANQISEHSDHSVLS